jgi:hypothetical protein
MIHADWSSCFLQKASQLLGTGAVCHEPDDLRYIILSCVLSDAAASCG